MQARHIGREQITVSSTAIGLDAGGTIITNTNKPRLRYAELQILSYQVRATFDGSTAPVAATTGQLWSPTSIKRVWGVQTMENLSMIRESSDATVIADYWGEA